MNFAFADLNMLRQRPQVFATIAAARESHFFPRRSRKPADGCRRYRLLSRVLQHRLDALGVDLRLVVDAAQAGHALRKRGLLRIEHAGLNAVVKPLQANLVVLDPHPQFGKLLAPSRAALFPAIEDAGQNLLQPVGLQQPLLDMAGDDAVELVHRDRAAGAAGLALPGFDRAGIVAVLPALASADCHRAAALGAVADAGQQRRVAGDARRRDLLIALAQKPLNFVEGLAVDQRRLGDGEAFFMNWDSPDSFDSRYFGPLPLSTVVGQAIPLWTDEDGAGRFEWRAPTLPTNQPQGD